MPAETGKWIELPEPMSFDEVYELSGNDGIYLRRGDLVEIQFSDGERRRMTVTGGYNGYFPARHFLWNGSDEFARVTAIAEKARIIISYFIQLRPVNTFGFLYHGDYSRFDSGCLWQEDEY